MDIGEFIAARLAEMVKTTDEARAGAEEHRDRKLKPQRKRR